MFNADEGLHLSPKIRHPGHISEITAGPLTVKTYHYIKIILDIPAGFLALVVGLAEKTLE